MENQLDILSKNSEKSIFQNSIKLSSKSIRENKKRLSKKEISNKSNTYRSQLCPLVTNEISPKRTLKLSKVDFTNKQNDFIKERVNIFFDEPKIFFKEYYNGSKIVVGKTNKKGDGYLLDLNEIKARHLSENGNLKKLRKMQRSSKNCLLNYTHSDISKKYEKKNKYSAENKKPITNEELNKFYITEKERLKLINVKNNANKKNKINFNLIDKEGDQYDISLKKMLNLQENIIKSLKREKNINKTIITKLLKKSNKESPNFLLLKKQDTFRLKKEKIMNLKGDEETNNFEIKSRWLNELRRYPSCPKFSIDEDYNINNNNFKQTQNNSKLTMYNLPSKIDEEFLPSYKFKNKKQNLDNGFFTFRNLNKNSNNYDDYLNNPKTQEIIRKSIEGDIENLGKLEDDKISRNLTKLYIKGKSLIDYEIKLNKELLGKKQVINFKYNKEDLEPKLFAKSNSCFSFDFPKTIKGVNSTYLNQ